MYIRIVTVQVTLRHLKDKTNKAGSHCSQVAVLLTFFNSPVLLLINRFLSRRIYDNICMMVGNLTGYIITQGVLTSYSNLLGSVVRNAE